MWDAAIAKVKVIFERLREEDGITLQTVSYTHLDVYKRQAAAGVTPNSRSVSEWTAYGGSSKRPGRRW